jgi:hypothetical protein
LAQNLLYQLQLKAMALEARVEAVVAEFNHLVIRSDALEEVDRVALQRALGERIRVQRREIYLPLGPEKVWRAELVRTLQVIYEHVANSE